MLVQYKSTITNNVEVILIYSKEYYKYTIKSGRLLLIYELFNTGTKEVIANYNLIINSKDKHNYNIDDLKKKRYE